jgi:hypothetical protein
MEIQKDLNTAKIVPNKQAAGIKLGASKHTVLTHWGEPNSVEQISPEDEQLEYDNVTFWLTSGKVDQIGVHDCYEGKTQEGIQLGSTRDEVEEEYGVLAWDGTWRILLPPYGIGFDFEYGVGGIQYVTEIYTFPE